MLIEDDDDILGMPAKRPVGRPPLPETVESRRKATEILEGLVAARRERTAIATTDTPHITVADVYAGVTVSWLAQVFGLDPGTVKKRLKDCPPLHRRKTGFVYELRVAAQYLVTPKVDIEGYMKTAKASELPTHLQEAYWSAKQKQQQWELRAGMLWRTEAVLEVLGDVALTIKQTMQIWPDNVQRATGLSDTQRTMLIAMCDELQKDVYERLRKMPEEKATKSSLADATALAAVEADDDFSTIL